MNIETRELIDCLKQSFTSLRVTIACDSDDQGYMIDFDVPRASFVLEYRVRPRKHFGVSRVDKGVVFGSGADAVFETLTDASKYLYEALQSASKRLSVNSHCRCGSRHFNMLDYGRGYHLGVCTRRGHETNLGKAWRPVLDDFFCVCGGIYLPMQGTVVLNERAGPVTVLKTFICPCCATKWRLLALPRGGELSVDPNMEAAIAYGEQVILKARQVAPRCLQIAGALRSRVPKAGMVETFFRNLFLGWPEEVPPAVNDPLRLEFQEAVRIIRCGQ